MIASESVLFPEPFGPMIAWASPLRTARSMPLRIRFPSTLTWRSRIARSATRDSAERGLARRRPRELREVHAVERRGDARLQAKPDRSSAAALLADAVQDGIALGGADLRLDRTLERTDDVAGRDLRRIPGEQVAAPGAALPVHQARSPQRRDELLEIRERQILALGDGVQRHRPLTPVAREIDHEAHPVFAAGGDVKGRGGTGISEHFTLNCTRLTPGREALGP